MFRNVLHIVLEPNHQCFTLGGCVCDSQDEGSEIIHVTFCSSYVQSKNCNVDINYR